MEERIYDYWVATLQDGYIGKMVDIVDIPEHWDNINHFIPLMRRPMVRAKNYFICESDRSKVLMQGTKFAASWEETGYFVV